jgi:hypothetical protein
MALQAGLHKNLSEVLIPGVLKSYDTPDLLTALHPRSVVLVSPANALGQPAREAVVRTELAAAFDTDQRLGTPNRIRLMRRDARDPLPID